MKHLRPLILPLFLIPCLSGFTQNKTAGYLTEAYRFESNNSQLFAAYAEQADKEGLPRVALFFRAIAKTSSIHAGNFQKVLSQMGVAIAPSKPVIILNPSQLNIEDALKSVRMEAGIKYAEYLEQAKADGEKSAGKALRWAKETEQQSLQLFVNVVDALAKENTNSLPAFYWVCPKCGNLYDVANPEKECSFCYTEREKFIKISD
ncbi:MAG: rubrerythrin family protein [Bacteroidales bacterium]|nr:rubrerythrin family protein [Bacteroidales bacterium]